MNTTENIIVNVPLSPKRHHLARQFAGEQPTIEKGKQVYLNTLAVGAVEDFLNLMEFETSLPQSELFNPVMRQFKDVADLVIPGFGQIECRRVLPEETAFCLPPEARENRLVYVAVGFEESLKTARLLGFLRGLDLTDSQTTIEIDKLSSMESLLDYLILLEKGKEFLESDDKDAVAARDLVESQGMSLGLTVAALESVYRSSPNAQWRIKGGEVLSGETVSISRSLVAARGKDEVSKDEVGGKVEVKMGDRKVQRLADKLLTKLAQVWQE